MSEANETEVKVIPPAQTQYVKAKNETLTDLASFNAYGFVTLSDGQVVGIQTTGRHGISADDMYKDFQQFVTFLDLCAIDHAVKFVDKRNGMYQSEAQGPKIVNGSEAKAEGSTPAASNGKPKRNYKDPLTEAEKPAELVEVNRDVYEAEFDYFIIKPDLDEKSVVEFWKDGLDFPVGAKMNKWKHDTIKEKLATLGLDEMPDPSKPQKIRFAGVQYWAKGSEYTYTDSKTKQTKTTNYKDLLLLKPAL